MAKLTNEEIRKKVDKKVKEFMKSVKRFLAVKAGNDNGEIPAEWELSAMMLETYYREFLELTMKIEQLDSLTEVGRYGEKPVVILSVRDKSAQRLEALMKQMGLTMKSSIQMGTVEPQKEETPLDTFLKNKIEKR